MKKGGYQIIDLSAYKFTNGEAQSIPNAYNTIKNTKKVVLISGLTVDGTEYHDMYTVFIPYETHFYGLAQYEGNNIYFSVNDDGSMRVNIVSAKTPIAYLYNGVQLPALPNFDKEAYPYAYMSTPFGNALYLFPVEAVIIENASGGQGLSVREGTHTVLSYSYVSGDSWGNPTQHELEAGSVFVKPFWCNTDLYDEGGTLFLSASTPVPVYE